MPINDLLSLVEQAALSKTSTVRGRGREGWGLVGEAPSIFEGLKDQGRLDGSLVKTQTRNEND